MDENEIAKDYWFDDEKEIRDEYWHPREGEVVVDIGCHIGSYTIPALENGAMVYAVDPDETRLAAVRWLWEKNPAKAIGDPDRLVTVPVALAEPGGYTEEFRAKLSIAGYQEFHAPADAEFSTLDELAAEYKLSRLDWVKIDVEGAELGVLRGGEDTLDRFHPVLVVEAHDKVYQFVDDMRSERKCHDLLASNGYKIKVVSYTRSAPRDFWICT